MGSDQPEQVYGRLAGPLLQAALVQDSEFYVRILKMYSMSGRDEFLSNGMTCEDELHDRQEHGAD